jgi:hypothetical protein
MGRGVVVWTGGRRMEREQKPSAGGKPPVATPGIVIRGGFEPERRPTVSAFIWGGKVRPVPSIPYGRRTA